MPFRKPFFQKQKEARGEVPTVFKTGIFPGNVKVQVWMVFEQHYQQNTWKFTEVCIAIVKYLREEIGCHQLIDGYFWGGDLMDKVYLYSKELQEFFYNTDKGVDYSLSVVDCITTQLSEEEIEKINYRFRQAGMGYKIIEGNIIPYTDEHMMVNTIEPAIKLLHQKKFSAANAEFISAFEFYKKGNNKEAINAAIRCVETVLKTIADETGKFKYTNKDGLSKLIDSYVKSGILPKYFDNFSAHLSEVLKVPGVIRNQETGHGDSGIEADELDDYYVEYVLNLVASTVLFLIKSAGL